MVDISRVDAAGLLRDQEFNEILQDAVKGSAALATFRTIRMGTKIGRIPILSALPTAGWIDGDAGVKPTSDQKWEKKTITAEEAAVIIPIPENVFEDTAFGVWEEVRPRVAEALGKLVDQAVFIGAGGPPASFDPDLVTGATAAGQVQVEGAIGACTGDAHVDLAGDINQAWGLVERVGYDVNIQYVSRRIRVRLRGLRDLLNQPVYLESLRGDGSTRTLMGEDLTFVGNGALDPTVVTAIVGDRTAAIIGLRTDVEYKILTEATLTDGAGNVLYSLAEQDMIALRAKFRLGFAVADVLKIETGAREYPFAIVTPPGSGS